VTEEAKRRLVVAAGTILRLAPHVKFRHDETRGRWVVLAPERLLLPDEQAVEILKLVDGARSVDAVIDTLAQRFDAPRDVIASDVTAMLQDLADKGVLAG
jgi:pyrroloquinoline quinone biosynthesis protein D